VEEAEEPFGRVRKWSKKGLVYAPQGDRWWARRYATLPTADLISEDRIRVYFAALDDEQRGRIGYVEVDANNPARVLYECPEPVLDIGDAGCFDDSGVNPSCILNVGDKKYLYYIGWQRCTRVPYMLFAGLATSSDGMHFNKVAPVPVLDRTAAEPYLRSATSVLYHDGRFRCWYVSGVGWTDVHGATHPTYVIRHLDSHDGITWNGTGRVCIDFQQPDEYGFGRPWVVVENGVYRMWYSIRSRSRPYRIGYAESADGLVWSRRDDVAGITRSAEGWDSEMICYANVVRSGTSTYMFHNGNRHGASGFGYAVPDA
jgi:hypothetical protein